MDLKPLIREIPDFPKPGIQFKDITTLLQNGPAYVEAVDRLAEAIRAWQPEVVVGPEARGFVVASALAYRLGLGLVPVRKAGKLPAQAVRHTYNLEYGTDTLEIHADAIRPGQRVLVADDLLATGGTVSASIALVEKLGGQVVGLAFLIELASLGGRQRLARYPVETLVVY